MGDLTWIINVRHDSQDEVYIVKVKVALFPGTRYVHRVPNQGRVPTPVRLVIPVPFLGCMKTPSAVGLLENSALGWKVQSFEGDHEPMVGLRSYNRLLAQEVDPEGVPFGKSFCMYFSAVVRCQRWRGAPSRVPERDKR